MNVTNSQNLPPNQGIQFLVFSGGCGSGPIVKYGCIRQMPPGLNIFTATGLTPGSTYYLMIDGFGGDVCDYSINAVSGVNVLNVTPSAPTLCAGGAGVSLTASGGNGTYTWSPATNLNTTTGATVVAFPPSTTTYTVTSGSVGSISCPLTKNVTVTVAQLPSVTAPPSVCVGNTITLSPTTGGTWASSNTGIATVTNTGIVTGVAVGNATFTFTNTTTNCSNTTTSVNVTTSNTPTFTAIPAFCSGTTAPVLPTTSNNGINGTWSPAVSNTTSGTYTFTPAAGQCASITTLSLTVTPATTPTFAAIPAFCTGTTAPILPTTSTNGVTGTWNPATVSNTATGNYTFTPTAGLCATTRVITITVNAVVTPTFTTIAAICNGATAPTLPTTSNNGVTGTWNPAIVSNTTSGTYTFTPTAGLCATTATLSVTVNPIVTPTFTAIPSFCSGTTAPILPTTSNNGIQGTWIPATVSNTASGTYSFTPINSACATGTTLSVTVTPATTPTFNAIAPMCSGAAAPVLPTTSTNGITGTWNPAIVSNTTTGTYTFTASSIGCFLSVQKTITVIPSVTPTFNLTSSICAGSIAPILPITSLNGIIGTWNPAVVNNNTSNTYIFTPNAGQCATTATKTITVNTLVSPTFNTVLPFCEGSASPILSTISNNGIAGTWSPAIISNTLSGLYTFTPNPGQCATSPPPIPIVIIPKPVINIGADRNICENTNIILDATILSPLATYLWQDGSSNSTITVTQGGTYTVNVNNGLCSATKSVTISVDSLPKFSIVGKTTLCPGESIFLSASSTNNQINNYLWQNGNNNATISVNSTGNYTVEGTNNCGTTRKSIVVENGICRLFMPNAFTPNNDGKNDTYKPGGGNTVSAFTMEIYNRWGQKIYFTKDVNKGWNGIFETKEQPIGNYIYQVSYIENSSLREIKISGSFLLLR